MKNLECSFSVFNKVAREGIFQSLVEINDKNRQPVFVCIGSDLVLGDSLGPLVGTMLKKSGVGAYVYGTLNAPITAKEVEYAKKHVRVMHPNSTIIAIDAGVCEKEDVGLIKVRNRGLKPGLGVQKNLGVIGDMSIIGLVAPKSNQNYSLFNLTRLNLVYRMCESIVGGITDYITYLYGDHRVALRS